MSFNFVCEPTDLMQKINEFGYTLNAIDYQIVGGALKATTIAAYINEIAVDEDDPTEGITEFYAYLDTVVFKLAHYWGFIFADRFLETVVPRYTRNPAIILRYRRMLEDYLGYDIGFLHEF